MKFKSLILIMMTFLSSSKGNDKIDRDNKTKRCYALSMSGGGSKGSYEAGVLYGLVMNA